MLFSVMLDSYAWLKKRTAQIPRKAAIIIMEFKQIVAVATVLRDLDSIDHNTLESQNISPIDKDISFW